MIYQSEEITVQRLENDIAELQFNRVNMPINKFDQATITSLTAALDALDAEQGIKGLFINSAKSEFIVGADIAEFVPMFTADKATIISMIDRNNKNFNRLEQLAYPTCVAINGFALGGGFEFCLACDFRVMSQTATIGLPETKLGLMPGWGGTVRLPRIIGLDEAVTWIATGAEQRAPAALTARAVDAVTSPDALNNLALKTLQEAIDGRLTYTQRRAEKTSPLPMNDVEAGMAFFTMKAMIAKQAGKNYPAPMAMLNAVEKARTKGLLEALAIETDTFSDIVKTDAAAALIGIFLSDQLLSKKARTIAKTVSNPLDRAGVLGAGIMGGGIAYQSAFKGVPIKMKDIAQQGLDLGLSEASQLLVKRVKRGRMKPEKMATVLNNIDPTLTYDGFDQLDVVVEAVVENPKVKRIVLAEAEQKIGLDTTLVSNTSTITITHLAEALERPENFCGMHFFNPVHAMPLVEVVRGAKTSDETIAKTVAYANKMGKKAVVVNDCPGFLVNRVLFPYLDGFAQLLRDGADYEKVDKVMERWGWPMGPAYLLDVIGLDTAIHAITEMALGYPDRMKPNYTSATEVLFNNDRYGQKNKLGFYDHTPDKRGKLKKTSSATARELIASVAAGDTDFSDDDIVFRTMLPMATELARCLEDKIIATPGEADLALIYGIGFPPFRGGIFRWIDSVGLAALAAASTKFAHLGKCYELTEGMQDMLSNGKTYY